MSYYSSSRGSSRATDCKVYVGDLGNGAAKGELERAFSYYGPLRSVWVARNPPGFAFVEFEDPRDAEDAVKGMDGKLLCGSRVRVEMSTGMSRKGRGRPSRRQFDPNDRCYQCGDRGHYAYDCYRSRTHSRSRSRSRSRGRRYRSHSRSRSRSRSRSYSNSRSRRRSPSYSRRRSRSGSPVRSKSRTPVRSRSRSRSRSGTAPRRRSVSRSRSRSRSAAANHKKSSVWWELSTALTPQLIPGPGSASWRCVRPAGG
ncbi:serine and arginine rich splicing factor 7a isoform X2 [Cololabis saira]|uniref:serine and arginine rich splicing factor 7a isoform X2 n=1 Tax=Cololabis saira TaxID=129043 RepID=UPI002AD31E13|nr:serine and arginine rich splicing factor 7a isoform X2 [Cololabis saira]